MPTTVCAIPGAGGPKEAVTVSVRTLDEIWRQRGCPAVSVIKMDIEGGEYLAMEGAKEIVTLSRRVSFWSGGRNFNSAYKYRSRCNLSNFALTLPSGVRQLELMPIRLEIHSHYGYGADGTRLFLGREHNRAMSDDGFGDVKH